MMIFSLYELGSKDLMFHLVSLTIRTSQLEHIGSVCPISLLNVLCGYFPSTLAGLVKMRM
jgi:hypothetical protein